MKKNMVYNFVELDPSDEVSVLMEEHRILTLRLKGAFLRSTITKLSADVRSLREKMYSIIRTRYQVSDHYSDELVVEILRVSGTDHTKYRYYFTTNSAC